MSAPELIVRIERGAIFVREAPEVPGARMLLALSADESRSLAARLVAEADRLDRDVAAFWPAREVRP